MTPGPPVAPQVNTSASPDRPGVRLTPAPAIKVTGPRHNKVRNHDQPRHHTARH
jgi:hypothetical protein